MTGTFHCSLISLVGGIGGAIVGSVIDSVVNSTKDDEVIQKITEVKKYEVILHTSKKDYTLLLHDITRIRTDSEDFKKCEDFFNRIEKFWLDNKD